MDVRLPDGTIIRNVPDNISKAQLDAKLAANGIDVSKWSKPEAPEDTGMLGALKAGIAQNIKEFGQTKEALTGGKPKEEAGPNIVAAQPFQLGDVLNPGRLIEKGLYRLGAGAPEMAGAIAGGSIGTGVVGGPEDPLAVITGPAGMALGAGAVSAVKTLGPYYAEELKKNPKNPDAAFDNALKRAGAEGAISGASFALFEFKPFKTFVADTLASAAKDFALQAAIIQPTTAVAGQATQNILQGRPATEGLKEAYEQGVLGTLVPAVGTHLAGKALKTALPKKEVAPEGGAVGEQEAAVAGGEPAGEPVGGGVEPSVPGAEVEAPRGRPAGQAGDVGLGGLGTAERPAGPAVEREAALDNTLAEPAPATPAAPEAAPIAIQPRTAPAPEAVAPTAAPAAPPISEAPAPAPEVAPVAPPVSEAPVPAPVPVSPPPLKQRVAMATDFINTVAEQHPDFQDITLTPKQVNIAAQRLARMKDIPAENAIDTAVTTLNKVLDESGARPKAEVPTVPPVEAPAIKPVEETPAAEPKAPVTTPEAAVEAQAAPELPQSRGAREPLTADQITAGHEAADAIRAEAEANNLGLEPFYNPNDKRYPFQYREAGVDESGRTKRVIGRYATEDKLRDAIMQFQAKDEAARGAAPEGPQVTYLPAGVAKGAYETPRDLPSIPREEVEPAAPELTQEQIEQAKLTSAFDQARRSGQINDQQQSFLINMVRKGAAPTVVRNQLDMFRNAVAKGAAEKPSMEAQVRGQTLGLDTQKYDSTTGEAFGVPAEEIQPVVDAITSQWNSPSNVHVVQSINDLPSKLRQAAIDDGAHNARGVIAKNKDIFLIADNLSSANDAKATLFHEALGHMGLGRLFNTRLAQTMLDMYRTNKGVRDAADEWLKNRPNLYGTMVPEARKALAVEETLAIASSQGQIKAGLLSKAGSVIKDFARRIGMPLDYTDREVSAILARAHDRVIGNPTLSRFLPGFSYVDDRQRYSTPSKEEVIKSKAATRDMAKVAISQKESDVNKGIFQLAANVRNVDDALKFVRAAGPALGNGATHAILNGMPTHDVARWVGDRVKNIKVISDAIEKKAKFANVRQKELADLAQRWGDFQQKSKAGGRVLSAVQNLSTLLQVNPLEHATLADALAKDKQLAALKAVSKPNKRAIREREDAIRAVYKGGDVNGEHIPGWEDLAKYGTVKDGLSEGQRIYKAALEMNDKRMQEHIDALKAGVDKSDLNSEDKRLRLNNIVSSFEEARKLGVYFTLSRFGKYWVSTGKGKNLRFSMAENATARNMILANIYEDMVNNGDKRSLEQVLADGDINAGDNVGELRKQFESSSDILKRVYSLIDGGGFLDTQSLKDHVYDMYLSTLPEADMRRKFTRRKGTAGFSADTLRGFIQHHYSAINQISRLIVSPEIRNAVEQAKGELVNNPDALALQPFVDNMEARAKSEINPPRRDDSLIDFDNLAAMGNKAVFFWMLTSPKTALVQLTQLPMVGLPVLTARYGARAVGIATKYMNVFDKFALNRVNADGELVSDWRNPSARNSSYVLGKDAKMREALQNAWDEADSLGKFSTTYAADLTSRSRVPSEQYAGPLSRVTRGVLNMMTGAFHTTESLSRQIMVMSAAELEYAKQIREGASHEKAMDAAARAGIEVVDESMFDYSQYNKPPVLKGKGRLGGQFLTFPINMYSYLARNFHKSMLDWKLNPAERREAAIKFYGTIGMTLMFAGATGLPLYKPMMGLAEGIRNAMGADETDDAGNPLGKRNLDLWFRTWFVPHYFGPGSALATKLGLDEKSATKLQRSVIEGPVSALTDLNIGTAVSLDQIAPDEVWFLSGNPPPSGANAVRDMASQFALGPFGSWLNQFSGAANDFENGRGERGLEKILPAFLRNPFVAARLEREGFRTPQGVELRSPEFYTAGKLLGQTLGFGSSEVAEVQRGDILAKRMVTEVNNQRNQLLNKLDQSFQRYTEDPSDANEARLEKLYGDIEKYNEKNGMLAPITDSTMKSTMVGRMKSRAKNISGFAGDKRALGMLGPQLMALPQEDTEEE